MALRQPTRTPVRPMTIAEMEMTFTNSVRKPINNLPLSRPPVQAKRLVDLLAEIMPPPHRKQNVTSVKKSVKPSSHIQKTYLSTSKKQIDSKKADHTIVRRALNFISTNRIEDVQVHPNSKKITRHTLAQTKLNKENEQIAPKNILKRLSFMPPSKGTQMSKVDMFNKDVINEDIAVNKRISVAPLIGNHTYELRSRTSSNNSHTMFTQYRNVNNSFDASIIEESSPQINPTEKSIIEPLTKLDPNPEDVQLSAMFRNVLCKTESAECNKEDIAQLVIDIRLKVKENIKRNREIYQMTDRLLQLINKNYTSQTSFQSNSCNIPVSRKSTLNPLIGAQMKLKSAEAHMLPSEIHIQPITKFKTDFEISSKENVSPSRKNKNSPRSLSLKNSPRSIKSVNNADLRKAVLKSSLESNINTSLKGSQSPKNSKSTQMFKSLKNSVKFLKTPIRPGKVSALSNIAFETPNTRSRNITSNNIKRQLESLYDS